MVVPVPFTRALFLYGEAIRIPREADIETERQRVEQALNALAERAERMIQTE